MVRGFAGALARSVRGLATRVGGGENALDSARPSNRRHARRLGAAVVAAILSLALPAQAQAQTNACTAINSGALDFTTNFNSTGAPTATARGNGVVASSNGLRSAAYTSTAGSYPANGALFGASTYVFNAGDVISYAVTTNSVSQQQSTSGFTTSNGISTQNNGTFTTDGLQTLSNTANSTYTDTATITASTNAVFIQVRRGGTNDFGSFAVTATCMPAVVAPTVTSVTPNAGPLAGGTPVIIRGTGFTGATAVAFGSDLATNVNIDSATQITATTPARVSAGAVTVLVRNSAGDGTLAAGFTYVAAPTVTSVAPTTGPATGGTSVVIDGTNLTGASVVTFGGVAATSFTVISNTRITATSPAGAAGPVNIQVTTSGGTSAATPANQFTYIPAPTVTSVAPASGPTGGGTVVTITGMNFTGVTAVTFGATAATAFTFNSATSITATAPAGTGVVDIRVTTGGGTSATGAGDQFTYVAAPTVTALAPAQGPTAGGTTVVITGTGLSGATAVTFGATPATAFTVNSATQITATAPAGTGAVNVLVTTTGGTSAAAAGNLYTYVPAPTVTGLAPASGPTAGGTTVTITGTDFTGVTAVTFGATPATGFTFVSATQITATAPSGSGVVDVRVTTAGGTSATSAADQYTYVPAPTVTAVSPTQIPAAGGTTVTITGTNFTGATAVSFGATAATAFTVNSATSITATAPGGNGTANVRVTTAGGTSAATPANQFTYVPIPTVTGVSPNEGPTAGNTTITITGTGFTNTSTVTVGGTAATNVTFVNAFQLTARTPAGAAGAAAVAVTNVSGTSTTNGTFTYVAPPTANSQSVTTAYQTATAITLTGSDPNTPPRTLTYTVTTAPTHGTLSGTAPNLTYTPAAGYSGADSFTFTVSNGTSTSAAATVSITVQPPVPTVTNVAPAQGSTAGGTNITITGTGFTGATAVTVGGNAATGVTVVSDTQITAITPIGTAGAAAVRVTNGTGQSTVNGTFTYLAPPTANPQSVNVAFNTATAITLTASGSTPITYTVVTAPTRGTLSGTAPNLTYTPTTGQSGTDSFTFTATNGAGTSAPATVSITIGKGDQTITFTSTAPGAATVGGATYTVTATASSGLAVTFASATPGVCTLSGSTVSFTGTGTCTINADQAGDATYNAAPQVQQSFTVSAPTITVAPASVPAAQVGAAYSQTITASGGAGSYTFTVSAGALPAGLTLSSGGVLSGTPTAAGTFNFTVTATDSSPSGPYSGSRAYALTVNAPTLVLAPAANTATATALPGATGGQAYTQTITTSGGTAPYSYTVVAGALPSGLTLSSGGVISGTPTAAGAFTFRIRSTDSSTGTAAPFAVDGIYSITVGAPTITLAPASLPAGTVAAAYSQTITASGGNGTYNYAVTAGALPAGLTLGGTGILSGTPTAGGTFNFTITATDSNGFSGARTYSLTIAAATIAVAPATLPGATRNIAYSQTLTASGGTAPYTFTVTGGALPTGLTLASSGTLSGTPTTAGSFTFTATATDASTGSGPYTGSRSYTVTVAAVTITLAPTTLPAATTRVAYSQTITASGGAGTYTYAVTGGALPAGFTLANNGTLSGTTTTAGSFSFTVTATDTNGNAGNQAYTLAVAAPTITLAPTTLPDATTRVGYSQQLTASGGSGAYTFAVTAGALPSGITLSSGGLLSGTATAAASANFTVTATDANGNTGALGYTLTVTAPAIVIAPTTLPAATTGAAYSQALSASGGAAPYSYAVTAGALPGGITLSADGTLSGTATTGGSFTFTVTATDANGNSGSSSYTLAVNTPPLTLNSGPASGAVVGGNYVQNNTAAGGSPPYVFSVSSGTLPPGTSLNSATGTVSGSPTTAGSYPYVIQLTDSVGSGPLVSQVIDGTIGQAGQMITFADPGPQRLDQSPATLTATASSGLTVAFASTTTGVCTVSGNSVTLIQTGTCGITASQAGNANFAPASDVTQSFQVTAALLTANVVQPTVSATVGTPIAPVTPVTVSGGAAPYAYALSAPLPAGLSFSATTGEISGTPTAGQAATGYTVTITDASSQTASAGFSLTVAAPTLTLTPASLPNGSFEVAYSQQLSASGGVAPYRYAVTAGALPAGITLSADGLVAGTPTAFGTFNVTITVTDSATGSGPFSVVQAYTLTIQPPATPVAGNVAATVAFGSADNVITPQLSGGTATTLAIATAPTNGTARVEGQMLVYTPRAGFGGSDSFTYTAGNAGGTSAPATVSVTVSAPVVIIAPTSLPGARQGTAYSQQLSASGGTAPYSFAVTAGALPAGLTLSPSGALTGTPTASGTASFTVTATDSSTGTGPYRATQAYQLAVDQPPAPTIQPVPATTTAGSTTTAGTPVRIVLSDYVSGDYTDIEISTPPANGTVVLSRGPTASGGGITTLAGPRVVATYTARQGYSGTDSFSFVAVGPGGRSAPASVTITVLGTAPVVAPLTATTTQGVPVTVDLTGTATGGPFTAARIVAVTPAGSLATQLIEGGAAGNRTYRLTITPTLTYSGNATVSFVISNAFGESAPVTVTVAVAARPDPSTDSTVNGLSTAQADSTRRFANAQIQNFARRNEQLHNGGNGSAGYAQGVSLTGGDAQRQVYRQNQDEFMLATQGHAREVAGAEFANGALVRPGDGGMVSVAGGRGRAAAVPVDGRAATKPGEGDAVAGGRKVGSVAIWSGGAISVGTRDRTSQRDKLTVTTGGLSSGVDVKLGEGLILGVGGGYGADKTKVNGGEAQVKGDAWSIAGYGSWSPTGGLFIDGVFGGGQLDFDTRRLVAQTNSVAIGGRDGHMLFGSLAAGFDRRGDRFDVSLYGRVDWLSAELDGYTETGGGIYSLTFAERDLTSVQGVLGSRLAFPLGEATGRLRGEWRHEFNGTGAQLVDYADIVNLRYRTRGDRWLRNAFSLDAGIDFSLGRGWSAGGEIGGSAGSGAVVGTGKIELRKQF